MDQRGHFDVPVNTLPPKCPVCTFPDLDCVPQPYFLAKGTKDPNEMAQAVVGNFFVRERTRKILEAVAPGECTYYPTHDLKTRAKTPWFLAVPATLVRTATVKKRVPRCAECGEPKVAHPGSHYTYVDVPPIDREIFKSLNWSSGESTGEESRWYWINVLKRDKPPRVPPHQWTRIILDRQLYFSIQLEALLKSLRVRGLLRWVAYEERATPEDLAWVDAKRRLLAELGLVETRPVKGTPGLNRWFKKYLKKHAAPRPASIDWEAIEARHGVRLPESYKAFASAVGKASFHDVDEVEGFTVHVLPPDRLDFASYRKGTIELSDEESGEVDGLMFATTDHGDCLCFDLATAEPDYPVCLHDHELNGFESYAANFAECLQRLAGE
jgi:hypothetical protein